MGIFLYNITQIVKMSIPSVFILFFIPLFINRSKEQSIPLKMIKGITLAVFTAVFTGYLLSFLNCFNFIWLCAVYFPALFLTYLWVEGIKISTLTIKLKNFSVLKIKSHIMFLTIFFLMFIYFLFLRGEKVFFNIALYYSDPFVHLANFKDFLDGASIQRIFLPMGYYGVLGLINLFSFTDPMEVLRLLGPIQSTIIIFTLFFIVYEITKNKYAALFAAAILGIDTGGMFPNVFYRQILTLPQEFAMIFFLPAAYFAVQYMLKQQRKDIKYFFICVCNTLFIHVNVSILLLVLFVSLFITGVILKKWKGKPLIYTCGAGIFTAVIGSLPLVIWERLQKAALDYTTTQSSLQRLIKLYENMSFKASWIDIRSFFHDMINPIKDIEKWHNMICSDTVIYSMVISLIYVTLRVLYKKPILNRHVYLAVFSLGQLLYSVFYYGGNYNFPQIIYFERSALALSMSTFVVIGILMHEISIDLTRTFILKKKFLRLAAVYLLVFLMILIFPKKETPLTRLQHEGALKAYIQIRDNFEANSWTIISPVEEYPLVLGYGSHYELCNFPDTFSVKDAQNRKFSFTASLGTKHIFVFIEKTPLIIWKTMPPDKICDSKTGDPYKLYENRKKLEEYAENWVAEYIRSHKGLPNNAGLFYQDKDIQVYHIENLYP